MTMSEYIAALIGPVLIVSALSILLNREMFDQIMQQTMESPALIFLAGIAALVIGLVVVNAHNIWVFDWPVIITLFGWGAIVGGIVRILAPQQAIEMAKALLAHKAPLTISAALFLLLGIVLTVFGYGLFT